MTGRHRTGKAALFGVCLALTLVVYATMLVWSLPRLRGLAGGLDPFDLRPFGYDATAARDLLAALGPAGRDFYLTVQHGLDTAFPALMAVTLALAYHLLAPLAAARVLALVAIAAAGFDYLENRAVAALLRSGPEGASDAMIAAASRWTQLKSAAVTLALVSLIVLLALAAWRHLRAGR